MSANPLWSERSFPVEKLEKLLADPEWCKRAEQMGWKIDKMKKSIAAEKARNRYHAVEWRPGKWRVHDRENFDLPVYNQWDIVAEFDEDRAAEYVARENGKHEEAE